MHQITLRPSAAHRWTRCPGSVVLDSQEPDDSSFAALQGTVCHYLARLKLYGKPGLEYAASSIVYVSDKGDVTSTQPTGFSTPVTITQEMVDAVLYYTETLQAMPWEYKEIEVPVNLESVTGQDATGTPDFVGVIDTELVVVDAKFGFVRVEVESDDDTDEESDDDTDEESDDDTDDQTRTNEQLIIYAAAKLDELSILFDVQTVRLMIIQPRRFSRSKIREKVISIQQLSDEAARIRQCAERCVEAMSIDVDDTHPYGLLNPGEIQCHYCKAKATCPALREFALNTVADDAVDQSKPIAEQMPQVPRQMDNSILAECHRAIPLIEMWIEAVSKRVYSELLAGHHVPNHKLVLGRQGNRAWSDAKEVEAMLESMRVKEALRYKRKLISPTGAEKLAKSGDIGERQWPKLEKMITRAPGKPTVARADDSRPEYKPVAVADAFSDVEEDDLLEGLA